MQFPYYFSLFGEKIYFHFIFETLAFIVGIRVYYHLRRKKNDLISDENRLWILIGATLGALIGSRFIALLETPSILSEQTFLNIYKSKTVAGGFLGGLFGVELIKKIIGEKKSSGDLYVLPIIIALFIGRIGCFSMGIAEPTFGVETTFFTGINLGDGKLRHPVSLYEMIYMILLFILFIKLKRNDFVSGDNFKLFMILYFIYRFLVEFIKPYESIFLGLSIIQWSSIFIFIYYHKFIYKLFFKTHYA